MFNEPVTERVVRGNAVVVVDFTFLGVSYPMMNGSTASSFSPV
ncbi:hypothetical protein [Flavobacterium orientale]|nr:hypothetical protein [Flavobacterium orientale]